MIFVDALKYYPNKGYWSHLWADDLEELHSFAQSIELKRSWFQDKILKHYDLKGNRIRDKAIKAGAVEGNLREWARNYLADKAQKKTLKVQ
jgi:cephalosporin-C deacetylase-like acetyl esterase